jgi:hypothetical protein
MLDPSSGWLAGGTRASGLMRRIFLQGPLGSAPVGVRAGKGFKFREKINFGPSVKHFLLFYFFKKIIFFKKY